MSATVGGVWRGLEGSHLTTIIENERGGSILLSNSVPLVLMTSLSEVFICLASNKLSIE